MFECSFIAIEVCARVQCSCSLDQAVELKIIAFCLPAVEKKNGISDVYIHSLEIIHMFRVPVCVPSKLHAADNSDVFIFHSKDLMSVSCVFSHFYMDFFSQVHLRHG